MQGTLPILVRTSHTMIQTGRWIVFIVLWTVVCGQDEDTNPETQNYRFRYFVSDEGTGDVKSHEETKVGDVVNGKYSVGEQNGDLRIVSYTADEGGFRANIKYEEGGSPASAVSEKLAKESSAKSGYEFQWLPPNPDDIAAAGKSSAEEMQESSGEFSEEKAADSAAVGSQESSTPEQESSSFSPDNPEQEFPSFGVSTPSLGGDSSEPGQQSEEIFSEKTESNEVSSENASPPEAKEEDVSSQSSEEKPSSESPIFPPESAMESKESSGEDKSGSSEMSPPPEQEPESEENKSVSSETELLPDIGPEAKSEEAKAESAEAAESAPESAATEPGQMYLPPLPFQNLPFLNIPIPMGSPQIESNSPTIIYASQNFYNPWQWFGSRRAARDDMPSNEETNPLGANPNYIPDLGYLIMPRLQ